MTSSLPGAPGQLLYSGSSGSCFPPAQGRRDESGEEWVRPGWPRLELGVELAADEPGVVGQLNHLHQPAIGRLPREAEPELRQDIAVCVAYLPAMAMPLTDLRRPIGLRSPGAGTQARSVGAQPHRASQVRYITL